MPSDLSRRRLLKLSAATMATLTGCLSESSGSPPTSSSPEGTTSSSDACETPVGDTWDSIDESPTPAPCPSQPDPLRACAVREYVLGLEKHLRYVRAIDRYDEIQHLEYSVYDATVHNRPSGFLIHAEVFFSGNTASGTPPVSETRTPSHFDDTYVVSYLVTANGQWRATDRTGADRASQTPRQDGSPVSCASDQSPEPSPGTDVADGTAHVESLSVADFILYPLSGTHPHVHRQAQTQYVVVRLDTSFPRETIQKRLTLKLDGDVMPFAEHQPVPWEHDTVDLAFAVPKTETFNGGQVLFDQTELRLFSDATIERLNNPPVFEVSEPSVSPNEISAGERTTATVRFEVANTGDGRGTFGASLTGNFLSGSNTVTATLDAGARREITAAVKIIGEGEEATVRLDWGSDEWSADIPVVRQSSSPETPTSTL